jgi:hypothetical protein
MGSPSCKASLSLSLSMPQLLCRVEAFYCLWTAEPLIPKTCNLLEHKIRYDLDWDYSTKLLYISTLKMTVPVFLQNSDSTAHFHMITHII